MKTFKRMESHRKLASYLTASMLAVPIGMLPWIIKGLVILIWYSASPVSAASAPNAFTFNNLFAVLAILLALFFIVFVNIRADLVFEYSTRQARILLQSTSTKLLVLDQQYTQAIEDRVSFRILPELIGVQIERDLRSRIEHFAHYHRCYETDLSQLDQRKVWMALRQSSSINLLLAFVVSLLCFVLVGYLFLPLVLTRLFVNWPTVSAYRLEFVAAMHGSLVSNP